MKNRILITIDKEDHLLAQKIAKKVLKKKNFSGFVQYLINQEKSKHNDIR